VGFSPAEAAITGTLVGATATFSAAWLTQRATTKRDRERRIWDRRVDTYADLMTTVHVLAQDRAWTEQYGERPEDQSSSAVARQSAGALAARVELYSSEELRKACERSFDCADEWMDAWQRWHDRGEGTRLKSTRDRQWRRFTECVRASQEADSRLLSLLLADVHEERLRRRKKPLRRLLGAGAGRATGPTSAPTPFLTKRSPSESDHG
jgi:gas vesicle protein